MIKISIKSVNFEKVGDRTIRCTIDVHPNFGVKSIEMSDLVQTAQATCAVEDKFDEAFGRRLAYAKAKRRLYEKFVKFYGEMLKAFETLNEDSAKVNRMFNREDEYVKKLLNE